jgi:hypothetical protein
MKFPSPVAAKMTMSESSDVITGLAYNRFLLNARPEGDLRYFSKSDALRRSRKAMAVLICHGRRLAVCGTPPSLCLARRADRLSVRPT